MKKKTLAIILGGGQGSRLEPLTTERAKPAVPLGGKYRLVDIPVSNCLNSDIDRIFVLTQFNSASLNKHLKNTYQFGHFSESFVDVLAAEQTPQNKNWFEGTADAVRKCMHHFETYEFEYALILSGDQLYQMNFDEMIAAHANSKADISIATLPVNAKDATGFGILKSDNKNRILEFIEKPSSDVLPEWSSEVSEEMKDQGRIYLASMGIYIFNRDLLDKLMKGTATDFGKGIIPQSIKKHKVVSYPYSGYWTDIGTIESFWEANIRLTDDMPQFNLFDNSKYVFTRARMLPPSKISGTTLEKTVIGDGSIINASRIVRSVIGIRSRIGKGTTIENTYIMGNDFYQDLVEIKSGELAGSVMGVGERSYLNRCILDRNCCIGDDVRINGGKHLPDSENELYWVRDGIVIVKKGAKIPNGYTI
jgi:glucose-1-phosphate adenylyltransferase